MVIDPGTRQGDRAPRLRWLRAVSGGAARGAGWGRGHSAQQNSGSYLASENLKRETSAEGADKAREGIEGTSKVFGRRGAVVFAGGVMQTDNAY